MRHALVKEDDLEVHLEEQPPVFGDDLGEEDLQVACHYDAVTRT